MAKASVVVGAEDFAANEAEGVVATVIEDSNAIEVEGSVATVADSIVCAHIIHPCLLYQADRNLNLKRLTEI